MPETTAPEAVQIAVDALNAGRDVPYANVVVEALTAAGWVHDPDEIIRDRDAARAEIDRLALELRAERRSHAETWQRAADNGAALIEARADIERLTRERDIARELERQALVGMEALNAAGRFGRIGQ